MRWRGSRSEPLVVGVVALAAVASSVLWPSGGSGRGPGADRVAPAPDLSLVDQDGRAFSLAAVRGEVVAVFFGYTHCPDVCPATLAIFAQVHRRLQADGAAGGVRFLFVSVDPERDTPQRLRAYLSSVQAPVRGLTGAPQQVRQALEAWGVVAEKLPAPAERPGEYAVAHSASVLLVDRAGRVRERLPFGTTPEALFRSILRLLGP